MEEIAHHANGSTVPLEAHKLYRPIEFKLTSVFDSGKFTDKADSKPEDPSSDALSKINSGQYEFQTSWKNVHKIGPGFVNVGNTCFLNSVLQMLTYTPPFANYLLDKVHSKKCKRKSSFCALCAFEAHVIKCFTGNAKTLQPTEILKNIKMINKKFRIGRQEDAQEFLRDLIDSFQKSATGFLEKPPQKVLETTEIYRMFGGKLKSCVECKSCHHKSEIFEPFFDLSLELSKSESIEKCMDIFFKAEELKGANKYRCSNCKKLVEATKKFSIHQRPLVLTIHLKRFDNMFMRINKISRHIKFNETMSLSPYVSEKTAEPLLYDLQGIVIHMGSFCSSGHYFSYIKNSNGIWHLMNDESVRTSKIDNVLNQEAYMLTYVLRSPPKKVAEAAAYATKAVASKAEAKTEVRSKSIGVEEPKQKMVVETKPKVGEAPKPEIKKDQKVVPKPGQQVPVPTTPKEKMVVENGKLNGAGPSSKKMITEDIMPSSKKMKMEEEPKPSSSTPKEKVQVNGTQLNGATVEHEKTSSERIFEQLAKVNTTSGAAAISINGFLNHEKAKKAGDVIDELFSKKGAKKDGEKEIVSQKNGESVLQKSKTVVSQTMQEEVKPQEKPVKNGAIETPRVKENEKIPYSAQLGALLDQREARVYMKKLEESSSKKKDQPQLRRAFSLGSVVNPATDENEKGTASVSKKNSLMRLPSITLKSSPFEKLKRIAKVISLFPVKKRKTDVQNNHVVVENHNNMEVEEVVEKVNPPKQQEKQKVQEVKIVQKPAQQQQQEQSQQPQQKQKKDKRYFLKGSNELKGIEKDVEEWDIGEDGDVNEANEIAEQRKKLEAENADFFVTTKKVKDEYDAEYDKGKLKKVKKKTNLKKKKANNFQKTYEYLKRAGTKYSHY